MPNLIFAASTGPHHTAQDYLTVWFFIVMLGAIVLISLKQANKKLSSWNVLLLFVMLLFCPPIALIFLIVTMNKKDPDEAKK